MIQVNITDDHKMFVEGLSRIINDSKTSRVAATAYTASECRWMLMSGLPDVLLLDINLPDGNGIDLCSELMNKYPELKILALTSFAELTIIRRMLDAGALGYILKNAMADEIMLGVQTVASGEPFLCDEVDMLLKKQTGLEIILTKKERELLELICEGCTSSEIAERMFLSVETINSYRKNLLFKLSAKNTASMVRLAIEEKYI
ncbi:MAG: response regulator transcription factor [Fermentimonas sp.]|nr:response regulator transcription factor [Fermentimonas sp.]